MRFYGGTPAAYALVLAKKLAEAGPPFVVLCPNDEVAAELFSDIEAFCSSVLGIRPEIRLFPGWELSPYSSAEPSLRSRLARIATLGAIASPIAPPRAVITTLPASCQATLSRSVLLKNSFHFKAGEECGSREELLLRLSEAGYFRVDTVEDPGTFAVRGHILDLFPPESEQPFRLEFLGDFVEQIRKFDPTTQKTESTSDAQVGEMFICPAREVLIEPKGVSGFRERLKAHADDVEIPRVIRDPVMEAVQNGAYPPHSDLWAPFAYAETATFWDYFPESTEVIWFDEWTCREEWETFLKEQKQAEKEAIASGLLLPQVEALYPDVLETEKQIKSKSTLFLDRLSLETGESSSASEQKQVVLQPNTDLVSGTRHSIGALEPSLRLWLKEGFRVVAFASTQSQRERIRFLLEERGLICQEAVEPPAPSVISLRIGALSGGFRWPEEGLVCLTESEILGTRHVRRAKRVSLRGGSAAKEWSGLQALTDLAVGDAVVHKDHGIGLYQGLVRLDLSGAPSDFLLLEYANKDKLYLPVYRLNVVQKYMGSGEAVTLARLGTQQFEKTKEKVREAVKKLAVDLIQLYAERKIRPGFRCAPRDSAFREFEAQFSFDETPDQLKAIEETQNDLENGKIMDRLVCGDVGYGKTEVAIRAAFRMVSNGKQVAVLVPTTVLAQQHEESFRVRLKNYPLLIESVSRFKSSREQKKVLESLAAGKVDILIGTHRLLSRDVRFHDLGLIVVDEEHRFGVEHKERLKSLRSNTAVLTLTATPIPRTLHMALSGLRDISLMNTPPVDRLPIRTYVSKFDESLIQRAIEGEINRGGQVFFVHNRVQTIEEAASKIKELVPRARVTVAHGQMNEKNLEEAMASFYHKTADVLVCTSIIESGLDLPSANTIVVDRADTFGLAQLYQIRGRVGRGQFRAFAYLLLPEEGMVTELAKRRLEVIQRFVELGSGFSIASHDLEIRGGGDLLGPQQSGHIAAVGFDLYTELLEEAIREIEGKPIPPEESAREPEIKAPFPAFLSEVYVPDVHQRLSLYRRFSAAGQESEIDLLEEELQDRFGPLPAEAQNLLWLIRIKRILKKTGIDVLTVGSGKVSLTPAPHSLLNPARVIEAVSKNPKELQILPDSKMVARLSTLSLRDLYFSLEALLKRLTS